jgi:alanyl-tRNA synthetase
MNTIKLYNDNVYLSECTATVTDVTEKGVILDRTIFFPEGGGQSSDIGTLINSSDETTYPVTHASESGDAIIHEISNHNLQVGDKVICRINWPHRFDNMQRHCGEHLLSGAMYKLFGGVNRGFHMGEHFMTADINLEKDPSFAEVTWEMAMEAEELVNSHIWQDLPVKAEEFSTGEEAAKMPLRKELAVDEDVRVVTIGNDDVIADCVACCGTHPTSTAQIGLLKIYKVEKNKGMFRIYFEAGKRAMEDYRAKHDILTALSNRYSTGIDELTDKIEKQEKRHEETKNTLNKLRNVLISQKTEEIKKELSAGVPFISRFYDEFTPEDIMKIGKHILQDIKGLVVAGDLNTNTLILFSDGTNDCGKLVKDNAGVYNGKGGGRKDNARALFPDYDSMMLFTDALEKLLR